MREIVMLKIQFRVLTQTRPTAVSQEKLSAIVGEKMSGNFNSLISMFQTVDGALPTIALENLTKAEVNSIYCFIRDHAANIHSTEPHYWSLVEEKDVVFGIKDNPANLVVIGHAQPFHVCFDGLVTGRGKKIPVLGVFVFGDSIELDYKMGLDWNSEAIEGLFELIHAATLRPNTIELLHKENIFDEDGKIFLKHWNEYLRTR